jgi:hypothetical protein
MEAVFNTVGGRLQHITAGYIILIIGEVTQCDPNFFILIWKIKQCDRNFFQPSRRSVPFFRDSALPCTTTPTPDLGERPRPRADPRDAKDIVQIALLPTISVT